MLDGSRDTGRQIELWGYGLPAGADLSISRQPTTVDNGSAGADLAAQSSCELFDDAHVVGATDTPTHCHDDLRLRQIDLLTTHLFHPENLAIGRQLGQIDRQGLYGGRSGL